MTRSQLFTNLGTGSSRQRKRQRQKAWGWNDVGTARDREVKVAAREAGVGGTAGAVDGDRVVQVPCPGVHFLLKGTGSRCRI